MGKKERDAQFHETVKDPSLRRKFIELLQLGYPIAKACNRLGIHVRVYRAWKARFPDFQEEVVDLLRDPVYRSRRRIAQATAVAEQSEDWKIRFIAAFEKTGSRSEACLIAGAMATEVESHLDPAHKDYDPTFRELMDDADTRRLWEVEDELIRRAKTDTTAAKSVLAARMKDLYEPKADKNMTVNTFWFSSDGESQAMESLQKVFGSREVKEIKGNVQ